MSKQVQAELAHKQPSSRRYIPASKWNEYHNWPPPGGLRHLIFNAHENGFAPAFKRVGRRVLVDEAAFWQIVEEKNGGAK